MQGIPVGSRGKAFLVAAGLLATVVAPVAASGSDVDKSDNVTLIKSVPYKGGTDISADGRYLYAGQMDGIVNRGERPKQGGVHIFDVSGRVPKEVGFLACPGNDNDPEVVKPGLIVVGFHNNMCVPSAGNGLLTVDVSNPRKPRILGSVNTGKNHTHRPFPGTDLVYTSGGGQTGGPNAGPAIVDVSDPTKPEIVARPQTITMDCHDISFHLSGDQKLGFCAGGAGAGEVQIWDVSDPLEPVTIGKIYNALIQYSHFAVASDDGKLLAIDDEAFAVHDCNSGQSPVGRMWVYDISNPSVPIPLGSFAPPRGGDGQTNIGTYLGWAPSWCLAHFFDWKPDTYQIGVAWYTGGMSVLDFSEPTMPSEAAHFHAPNSTAYAAQWHKGLLYVSDQRRGLDVFDIDLKKKR